jgi:hypothetical protein
MSVSIQEKYLFFCQVSTKLEFGGQAWYNVPILKYNGNIFG